MSKEDIKNNLKIGEEIENFKLKNQKGEEINLKDLRGKKVLVSFHPLAWTPVCTDQMRDLERNYDRLKELGVISLGISVDPEPTKTAWASALALEKLNILADFTDFAKVAKIFDVFIEESNTSGRANFIIDEEGKLIWKKIYHLSTLPDLNEIIEFLEGN